MSERAISEQVMHLQAALIKRAKQRRIAGEKQAWSAYMELRVKKASRWGLKGKMGNGNLGMSSGFQT